MGARFDIMGQTLIPVLEKVRGPQLQVSLGKHARNSV